MNDEYVVYCDRDASTGWVENESIQDDAKKGNNAFHDRYPPNIHIDPVEKKKKLKCNWIKAHLRAVTDLLGCLNSMGE